MAGQVVHDQYQLGTGRYLIQDLQDPHNVRHFEPILVFAPPRHQPCQPNIQARVDLDEVATRFSYLIAAEAIWADELDQERGGNRAASGKGLGRYAELARIPTVRGLP